MNKLFTFLFSLLTFTCIAADSDTARLNDPAFLKGYWPLSKDALDYSGNGNHGTWSGTEAYQQGPFGKDIFSSAGTVTINTQILNSTNAYWTITSWYNPASSATSWEFKSGDPEYAFNGIYLRYVASSGWFQMLLGRGGAYSSHTITKPITYFHTALVCSNKTFVFYINGKYSYEVTALTYTNTSSSLLLYPQIKSQLSNFRLYNIALSAPEIASLYRMEQSVPKYSPSPIADPTCQLWLWNGQDLAQGRAITNYKVQTGNGVHRFNGSDSYLSTTDFLGTNDYSFTCWFRANSVGGGSLGNFFNNGNSMLLFTAGGDLNIRNKSSEGTSFTFSTKFPQWTCITLVRTGRNVSLYKNGIFQQTVDAGTLTAASTGLYIGSDGSSRVQNGSLGHVIIWSRVLSAAEIKDVYDSLKIYY